jgi:hypothetical protein
MPIWRTRADKRGSLLLYATQNYWKLSAVRAALIYVLISWSRVICFPVVVDEDESVWPQEAANFWSALSLTVVVDDDVRWPEFKWFNRLKMNF